MARPRTLSPLDRAADAALAIAAERGWAAVTLKEISERAGVALAVLFDVAESKGDILAHIAARFDRAPLTAELEGDAHDRLFEATMARVEAMEPHRDAVLAIHRGEGALAATRLPRTARAILEAAGIEATVPRLAAMVAVWGRVAQVWRSDEGALNRTMAEIDKRLRQMNEQLSRIGAGF